MIFFQSRDLKEDLSCECKCSIFKSKGDFKHSLRSSIYVEKFVYVQRQLPDGFKVSDRI